MSRQFLQLKEKEQLEILQYYAAQANKNVSIVEKDIWICWILKHLFEMPNRLNMAFKGGTSLSKVYNVIDRFSEDIDITLDYRQFDIVKSLNLEDGQTAPDKIGSGMLRRINNALKENVKAYAEDIVAPYLKKSLLDLPNHELFEISVSDDGEKLHFFYPSLLMPKKGHYLREEVLIEFGGRNIVNPNETHLLQPHIADLIEDFAFPNSSVVVLSPERTFWEKATLIHVECHRGVRENAERLSRHWFDLVALANHKIGEQAVQNIPLLHDVVSLKNIFFNASYAHYDQCLVGKFRLVPNQDGIQHLIKDFTSMKNAGMLNHSSMTFDEILTLIHQLEKLMNQTIIERNH